MVKINPPSPDGSSDDATIPLTPQQLKWKQQGYGASVQMQRIIRDKDGNRIGTEVTPEEPADSHEITTDEFYQKARGGPVKAWSRSLATHRQSRASAATTAPAKAKPNW